MEDIAGEVEKIGSAISSDIEIYLKKKELVKLFDHFYQRFRNVTGIFLLDATGIWIL